MIELTGRLSRMIAGMTIEQRMRSMSFTLAPSAKKPIRMHITVSSMNSIVRLSTDSLKLKFARVRRVGLTKYTAVGIRQSTTPATVMGRKYT